MSRTSIMLAIATVCIAVAPARTQDLVVRGEIVHTMAGEAIENGVVVIQGGVITAVGPAGSTPVPAELPIREAAVVTPGLIDAHTTVGLAGILNQDQDNDELELSEPIQPELRALDAYNAREPLVAWLRSFGITTVHDPSNDTSTFFASSELGKAGLITAPRLYSTGTILYGAAGSFKAIVNDLDLQVHVYRDGHCGAK